MKHTRWLAVLLLAPMALTACAEQAEEQTGEQQEATMQDTTPEQPPYGDTASADLAVWNTDADATLGIDEFTAWLEEQGFYAEWNTDGAEGLTVEELGTGLAAVLDTNDDGAVSAMEWGDAGASWTGDEAELADWDANADGALDPAEVAAGLEGGTLWGQWDQDGNGTLSQSEFHTAVFSAWDANGDGAIDETEWRANFDAWA